MRCKSGLAPIKAVCIRLIGEGCADGRAGQLGRAEAGRRWVAEAARVDDVKPKRLPGGDDSEEEVEEEYDVSMLVGCW